jgi:hypothetical protein
MPSLRKLKANVAKRLLNRHCWFNTEEDRLWDRMPAVGREFGSPDFERLMAEDHRDKAGVFGPSRDDE